jgi:hypothetical protein
LWRKCEKSYGKQDSKMVTWLCQRNILNKQQVIFFRKESLFMKSKKLVGLFAAALLVVPLAGCDEDDCTDSQGNQVSCENVGDSGGIDID